MKDESHFRLRIPNALKTKIEQAAGASHRSINAEIIARLETSFAESKAYLAEGADLVALKRRMDAMAKVIRQQIGDEAADEIGL